MCDSKISKETVSRSFHALLAWARTVATQVGGIPRRCAWCQEEPDFVEILWIFARQLAFTLQGALAVYRLFCQIGTHSVLRCAKMMQFLPYIYNWSVFPYDNPPKLWTWINLVTWVWYSNWKYAIRFLSLWAKWSLPVSKLCSPTALKTAYVISRKQNDEVLRARKNPAAPLLSERCCSSLAGPSQHPWLA